MKKLWKNQLRDYILRICSQSTTCFKTSWSVDFNIQGPLYLVNVILSSLINLSSHLIFNGISLKTLVMTYLSFEIYLYVINDKDNIYQRNDLQWLGILNRTFQMCIIIVIMNLVSRRKYSRWSKAVMGKTITSSTTRSLAPGFSLSSTWQRYTMLLPFLKKNIQSIFISILQGYNVFFQIYFRAATCPALIVSSSMDNLSMLWSRVPRFMAFRSRMNK